MTLHNWRGIEWSRFSKRIYESLYGSASLEAWGGMGSGQQKPPQTIDGCWGANNISMTKAQDIPWRRIAVEAAAIVVSILLAFGIDAWWDEIKRSADERDSLALLSRDVLAAVEQLEEFVEFSSGASRAALRA